MKKTKSTSFEQSCTNSGYDPAKCLPDVSNCPEHMKDAIMDFAKLLIITEDIRGKDPDWNDRSEGKWFGWWDMEKDENNPSGFRFVAAYYGYSFTRAAGGSRLCLLNEPDLLHVAKHFEPLFRNVMVIPKRENE